MNKLGIGIMMCGFVFAGTGANISGKWEVQVEGYGAPRTQKFELKQKGDALTGTYQGKFGESKVTGTVKDSAVEFEMTVIENDHIMKVHYEGTEAGGELKGTVTFGEEGKGTWVAERPSGKKK
jgi:hypothetical protein